MSLESVTAFQPFVMESGPPWLRQRGLAGELGRRLASVLRWREEPAVFAQLAGSDGPPDVAAAVSAMLGDAWSLQERACERRPKRGPLLVLAFDESRTRRSSERSPRAGNVVSPAALSRIVRACGAPVLPVLGLPDGRLALAGTPVPAERLARIRCDAELLRWLRLRAGILRHRPLADARGAHARRRRWSVPCRWRRPWRPT